MSEPRPAEKERFGRTSIYKPRIQLEESMFELRISRTQFLKMQKNERCLLSISVEKVKARK